jgi:hypothetical protein
MQPPLRFWPSSVALLIFALSLLASSACSKKHSLGESYRDDAGEGEEEKEEEEEEEEEEEQDAGGSTPRDTGAKTCAEPGPLPVDLLFMIDNSGSMAEEQRKLAAVLPNLVAELATGNLDGSRKPAGTKTDFAPVQSLHIGVVTSDMGINGAPAQNSCGDRSFLPTEHDSRTSTLRVNKPVGDDGILQTDIAVAVDGVWGPDRNTGTVINYLPADPSCSGITFPPNARFVDFSAGGDAAAAAQRFSCVVKRGRNGCGLEQQLEAVLKALTPPDSNIKFTAQSPNGHGNAKNPANQSGFNQAFLRDDAILAVVVVSDEEDCSIPDQSRGIFDGTNASIPGGINVRCGLKQNAALLHSSARYVEGLKALKPDAYRDRVIFAGVVGVPLASMTGAEVHSGADALDGLLARPDMQFMTRRNPANTDDEAIPTCVSAAGDGSAAPGRRYLEVAKGFEEHGLVASICEDGYGSVLRALSKMIAEIQETPPRDCR